MSLDAPLWLLALLPLAAAALLLRPRASATARTGRRAGSRNAAPAAGRTEPATWAAWALRAAAAVALVVALAQPQRGPDEPAATVLLLDRSASVDDAMSARERAWVRAAIAEQACATPCRVVQFAATAAFAGLPASGALPPAAPL
ncbi:hypothetical protein VSS74_31225, partial [Conexibacter stalactiti]